MLKKLHRIERQLSQSLGREAQPEELATVLGIPVAKVVALLNLTDEPVSLETPVGEGDSHFSDLIEDRNAERPERVVVDGMISGDFKRAFDSLEERSREVLMLRYGLGDADVCTLEEVGNRLGVTRERVRQVESRAMRELSRTHPSLRDAIRNHD